MVERAPKPRHVRSGCVGEPAIFEQKPYLAFPAPGLALPFLAALHIISNACCLTLACSKDRGCLPVSTIKAEQPKSHCLARERDFPLTEYKIQPSRFQRSCLVNVEFALKRESTYKSKCCTRQNRVDCAQLGS